MKLPMLLEVWVGPGKRRARPAPPPGIAGTQQLVPVRDRRGLGRRSNQISTRTAGSNHIQCSATTGPAPSSILKVASGSLPGSSGSVQPRTRPRARGLRGSAEGRPCRSVFPSAVRNFHTFRPEAFDAVLRPQNLTGEVSAGVWRGRRPSRSDLPSRGVDGRRAYLVTSGSRAKPGTIVRGRYTFGWSIGGRRMVSCTRPLAQEHIPSSLA